MSRNRGYHIKSNALHSLVSDSHGPQYQKSNNQTGKTVLFPLNTIHGWHFKSVEHNCKLSFYRSSGLLNNKGHDRLYKSHRFGVCVCTQFLNN